MGWPAEGRRGVEQKQEDPEPLERLLPVYIGLHYSPTATGGKYVREEIREGDCGFTHAGVPLDDRRSKTR